jgi:hypothetical protein
MTSDDIATTISDFRHAAKMLSKRVQMVSSCGANGYLLQPCLRRANHRSGDQYGAPPKTDAFRRGRRCRGRRDRRDRVGIDFWSRPPAAHRRGSFTVANNIITSPRLNPQAWHTTILCRSGMKNCSRDIPTH